MTDRFEKLYELPGNLYTENSPVILSAGVLLMDTQTGKVVVQLKFHSVSITSIKALKVSISAFDVSGKELSGVDEYQYLDMDILIGQDFGANKAIILPEPVARSFSVRGLTVLLDGGAVCEVQLPLTELPKPTMLFNALNNPELVRQYQLDLSTSATFVPQIYGDLWMCSCHMWNKGKCCTICQAHKRDVFSLYNVDDLQNKANERLENERIEREQKEEQARIAEEEKAIRKEKTMIMLKDLLAKAWKLAIVVMPIIFGITLFSQWLYPDVIKPNYEYNNAQDLVAEKRYDEAVFIFECLGDFKDSEQKVEEIHIFIFEDKCNTVLQQLADKEYSQAFVQLQEIKQSEYTSEIITEVYETIHKEAELLLENGQYDKAARMFAQTNVFKDGLIRCWDIRRTYCFDGKISAGTVHTVKLKSDGSVVATGSNKDNQCDVSEWRDIVAIACGAYHTTGVKSDGSVVATGSNKDNQCDVSEWRDIVTVACGYSHTVGLKSDGSVVATGNNEYNQCDVSEWRDIVAVTCGALHTVGVKSDGSVVATGYNEYGQCDVSEWRDIVAVSCGLYHTVGLKSDGSVVATGSNKDNQCDVSEWRDIVTVACGYSHTVGLKSDGSVVATGNNEYNQCDVSEWRDIVAITCGHSHSVGLKSDGSVVATGNNEYEQCDVDVLNIMDSSADNMQKNDETENESKDDSSKNTSGVVIFTVE